MLDQRWYDAGGRVLRSGPAGTLRQRARGHGANAHNDLSTTTSHYDAIGRLLSQHVVNEADSSLNYGAA